TGGNCGYLAARNFERRAQQMTIPAKSWRRLPPPNVPEWCKVALGKKKSFTRLIIRIAIIAIAISMAVMICTTALVSGFKYEIKEKIFGFWGHIHITKSGVYESVVDNSPIPDSLIRDLNELKGERFVVNGTSTFLGNEYEKAFKSKQGIRHIQSFALIAGIIKAKDDNEGIILKGAGADFNWTFLSDYILEGDTINWNDTLASNEMIISEQTSNRLKLKIGDRVRFAYLDGQDFLQRAFEVVGVYRTGLEEFDERFAIVDIRRIQRMKGWKPSEVGGFEVFIDDVDDLGLITEHLYFEVLDDGIFAETIEEKQKEIFQWLELQNINEVVILSLMIIVAIINMITALLILILERTNMIGVLKSLGSSNWGIRKVFLYYAAYIIGLGIFWGNLIGLALCILQDRFKFIKLDEANYYLSYAPIDLNWGAILLLNLGTLVIVILFLVLPSYLVTRINPIKAIKFK
ncbi:MAG: FtsX-like permease family protein, partial [Bacteroidota bacterium]